MEDHLYTVTEAAEKLGVSRRTIQRYCRQGRLDYKWVQGTRHRELRIVPPISIDKLPGVKRRPQVPTGDFVSKKTFEDRIASLEKDLLKKDIRIDELKEEITILRNRLAGMAGQPGTATPPDTYAKILHDYEKVRPQEKKIIVRLTEMVKQHEEALKSLTSGSGGE